MKNNELAEILMADADENGEREVVLKTTGGYIYPNSTYALIVDPAWKEEDDKRLQIWPNGTIKK
jgi:hypothetical protein